MLHIHSHPSPVGGITMLSDGEALTALRFDGEQPKPDTSAILPVFEQADRWLDIYFSGRAPDFTPPLRLTGTDFQTLVWNALLSIPFGHTATYGEVAEWVAQKTGRRPCARAVGGALNRNPVALIVPCHRVIGSDGTLTGYAGGLERKRKLLAVEGIRTYK